MLIVSNNDAEPIQEFLAHHQLDDLVDGVVGRVRGKPELVKPNPDSINRALAELSRPAPECAFVGDSVTDVEVAHLTGVRSVGYAKNPRRGAELAAAGAEALVHHIGVLAT